MCQRNLLPEFSTLKIKAACSSKTLISVYQTSLHLFTLNSENHTKSTRQFNNFYHPITNLTVYQRGVHYMGIKIFNNLPPYIKDISNNVKKFEICLKRFQHIHSFYSIEEYFQHKSITS